MNVYLVRHGEAERGADDSARSLSPNGRNEVLRVAKEARELGVAPARILHSGKLRALQTAQILAAELAPAGGVAQESGLSPDDDPARAAAFLRRCTESVMLVGHLPHLGLLVTLLVEGKPGHDIVAFHPSTLVCLSLDAAVWKVERVLRPDPLSGGPGAGVPR